MIRPLFVKPCAGIEAPGCDRSLHEVLYPTIVQFWQDFLCTCNTGFHGHSTLGFSTLDAAFGQGNNFLNSGVLRRAANRPSSRALLDRSVV